MTQPPQEVKSFNEHDASAGTPKDTREENNLLELLSQNIEQRRYIFWICIIFIFVMYAAFYIFILGNSLLCLVHETPFGLIVATFLGIIPTLLLITLITVVYRQHKAEKATESDGSCINLDDASKIATVLRAFIAVRDMKPL